MTGNPWDQNIQSSQFSTIFCTKTCGSRNGMGIEGWMRDKGTELHRVELSVTSTRGHIANWNRDCPALVMFSAVGCCERMPLIWQRILRKLPSIDSTRGRKNGYSSTASPVSVLSLLSRSSIQFTRSKRKNADTKRKISSAQVSWDNGSGPVQLKAQTFS